VQAVVIPIADRHVEYCNNVAARLKALGIRATVDERSERMNAKIRDAQTQKIPYMLVVGDKEMESNQVALRLRNGENPGPLSIDNFTELALKEISKRYSHSHIKASGNLLPLAFVSCTIIKCYVVLLENSNT
jgi:threonyl-tRNA synthetase